MIIQLHLDHFRLKFLSRLAVVTFYNKQQSLKPIMVIYLWTIHTW